MSHNIIVLHEGQQLRFTYTNRKGERELREVSFISTEFGFNRWYPEPTIFLRCYDPSRSAERSFDVRKMENIEAGWGKHP
jgi:predicted DNA-binding transcriptional regulator YafY